MTKKPTIRTMTFTRSANDGVSHIRKGLWHKTIYRNTQIQKGEYPRVPLVTGRNERTMKKVLAIALALMMVFAVAMCLTSCVQKQEKGRVKTSTTGGTGVIGDRTATVTVDPEGPYSTTDVFKITAEVKGFDFYSRPAIVVAPSGEYDVTGDARGENNSNEIFFGRCQSDKSEFTIDLGKIGVEPGEYMILLFENANADGPLFNDPLVFTVK